MARATRATTATRDATPRKIFFTIVAWNYIAYAATLMESVAAAHPDSLRAIIICDVRAELGATLSAEILYADQIGIDDVASMAFAYGVMEFATAVKPSAFLHFLRAHPDAHVVYLDPDIQLAAPLVHVFAALAAGAGLALTPHMTRPLQDGFQPDDLTIMKSGVHNLGFLAARAEPETLGFLRWWADRCRRDAIVDIPNHKFTDQRWVDLAPSFVGATHLLRHPGYNIAYWNLSERRVARRGRTRTVNGEKIHFLHFSGVVPSDPTILSKHQDRFALTDLPSYAELHTSYIDALLANGWRETTRIRYGFDRFADGRKIHRCMRASFRRHEGRDAFDGAAAFASDGAMFDADEPSLARSGPPGITRVMHELREERIDLRRAFATDDAAGRAAYLDWFVSGGGAEAGFDAASLAGAGRLREAAAPAPAEAARPRATLAPWDPQSTLIHDGPPGELEAWLCAPTPIKLLLSGGGVHIPRLLALLWEARADLRQHFALQSAAELEAYLAWCVTSGVREGAAPIDLLGPRLGPYLDAAEGETDPARAPDRPPRTRLLRLVGHAYRGAFADIPDHDRDDRALLARTLWLCGAMRDQHDWPIEMVARPTAWLRAPSALRCGGFAAPNIVEACYRLRRDVQDAFDAATETGVWRVVAWFVVFGSGEFSLAPALCGPAFLDWLRAPAEAVDAPTELTNLDRLVWLARPDVTASFRIDQPAGRAGLRRWMRDDAPRDPAIRLWLEACAPRPPTPAPNAARRQAKICLTGLWGAASGRGEDVRLTAAALRAQNIDFVVFDRRSETFFDSAGAPAEIDASSIRVNIAHLNADTALYDFLAMRRAGLIGARMIGYWAWELERLPEAWNFAFGLYREIWASTNFAAGAFRRGGRPVHVMPMAVDLPEVAPLTRADFGLAADEFVFYYGFDYRSYMARKNPEAAIAGFLAAFGAGTERVRLVLKTLAADERPAERDRIAALAASDPRITLIDGEMARPDLFALLKSCDCYVSPHRSEGFGRGPAEAMLLGLPVIATGYSGNMDFTIRKTAFVVDYTLIPVESGAYPGGDGQVWAEIDLDGLAATMRVVVDKPARRRAVAKAGQRMMRERFSVEKVGHKYARRLQDAVECPTTTNTL